MSDVSRRQFLGGAALGAAGLAVGSMLGCSPSSNSSSSSTSSSAGASTVPESYDASYDVIVCGAGGTGLAAACAAATAGAGVMVYEKSGTHGGTSSMSGGVIQAAGTKWQKKFTTFQEDTPEKHAECYIKQSEGIGDEELIKTLCTNVPARIDWLESIGVVFNDVYGNCHVPYCDPENLHADRIHVYEGGGAAMGGVIYMDAEYAEAQNLGAEFTFNAEVKSLITDENNAVRGVVVNIDGKDQNIEAKKGVVLGLGGIDRAEDLALQLNQQQYWDLTKQMSYISEYATGDGIRMGLAINAALSSVGGCIDYDMVTANATNNHSVQPPCIFVNKQGRRFVCEDATYAYTYRAIFQQYTQNDSTTWMILDQNAVEQGLMSAYFPKGVDAAVADGTLKQADTYEDLAAQIGIPPTIFADTMNSWNNMIATLGKDVEFERNTQLIQLNKPPYYAHENVSANLGSLGGLKIDSKAQVYDNNGDPIEHLFAGGMNSGGWYGLYYPGSGTSLAGGITFGWIAGESAAAGTEL